MVEGAAFERGRVCGEYTVAGREGACACTHSSPTGAWGSSRAVGHPHLRAVSGALAMGWCDGGWHGVGLWLARVG